MMKPMKVSFYLYAEDENQTADLEKTLYDIVMDGYKKGTLITAKQVNELMKKYIKNPLVSTLLHA